MNKKLFFAYLKKNIPENKYKDTFLEDLSDHLEDMEYEESFKGKSKEEKLLNRLGEPSDILFTYKKLMNRQNKISIYFESIFWSLLSYPLFIWPFFANSLTERSEVILYKTLIWIATLIITYFICKILYLYIFSHLKVLHLTLNKNEKLTSFSLTLILPILFSLIYIPNFYLDSSERQDFIFPIIIISYLVITVISAWNEFKKSLNSNYSLKNLWIYDLIFIILLIVIAIQINVLDFVKNTFFIPFYYINKLYVGYILLGLGASLMLVILLFIHKIYLTYKKDREFSIIKIVLSIFLIYSLIYPHKSNENINFEKKAVNLSEIIEKNQLSVFYNFSKFIRSFRDSPSFWYEIIRTGDAFEILQRNNNKKFVFEEPFNLENISYKTENFDSLNTMISRKEEFLPENVKCINKIHPSEKIDDWANDGKLTLGGETYCYELYYKNELIYKSNAELLQNVLISNDEKFLLIHLEDPFKEIDQIYLVGI